MVTVTDIVVLLGGVGLALGTGDRLVEVRGGPDINTIAIEREERTLETNENALERKQIDLGSCSSFFFTYDTGFLRHGKYCNEADLCYKIDVNGAVNLNFDLMDMEEHVDCTYDYVAIYENYNSVTNTGTLVGKYCGPGLPTFNRALTGPLFIHFHADYSNGGDGWSLTWTGQSFSTWWYNTYHTTYGTTGHHAYENTAITSWSYTWWTTH